MLLLSMWLGSLIADGMDVVTVTTEQIYNEFSSGGQDITAIRDFMRMLYDRATNSEEEPKYLLLFGDASYDYKNRISPNTNFVPIHPLFFITVPK